MAPQVGAGGDIPIPRKLREASANIVIPIFRVIKTRIEGNAFGRR